MDISQDNLQKKLTQFLLHEKRDLSFINVFKAEEGFCYGLTMLKLYCDQQPTDQDGIHNAFWFKNTVELISHYDQKIFNRLDKKKQEEQIKEINEFISLMIFIQDIENFFNSEEDINQFDAPLFLQDISPEKELRTKPLEIAHNFIGNFTQEKLKQWLETMTKAGLPIGTSIHLSTQEHSMYLQYINNDQYAFYDPNHESWHTNDSAEKVAKHIFCDNNNKEIILTSQVICLKGTELSTKLNYFFNPLNGIYERRTLLKNLKLWSSLDEIWAEIISIDDIKLLEDIFIQGSPDTVEEQINNGKIKIDDLLNEVAQYGKIKLFTFLTTKFSKLITSNDKVYEASKSASKYGFTDILQKVLSMNILTNNDIFKCLEKACKSGRLNIIKLLLEKYNFHKDNEGVENQKRERQIIHLFQLALISENLKTIEWLYEEYYNDLDPQSFIDIIKNIKDYKIIVWLLEKYPVLLKIKDTQQKKLYDWAIETKNDKAIILFRLANYIAKHDKDSEQLKLAKEIFDDIKYNAFNDCEFENNKIRLDILVKDDELYDMGALPVFSMSSTGKII
jgi:hypothetical protein